MSQDGATNVDDFIGELGAGVIKEKIAHVLSGAALGTVMHGMGAKKGKVSLEFTLTQVGENDQVIVTTKISQSVPTKRGKMTMEDATDTPMFVGKGGCMTSTPPREDEGGQYSLETQNDGVSGVMKRVK